jgi:hypothetical protein
LLRKRHYSNVTKFIATFLLALKMFADNTHASLIEWVFFHNICICILLFS